MKDKLWGLGFMLTILGGFISPVWAESDLATLDRNAVKNTVSITPANLVKSSYQGQFIDFGVPSHQDFTTALELGRVNSRLLVKSAIEAGRLSPEVLNDSDYLNNVEDFLNSFNRD